MRCKHVLSITERIYPPVSILEKSLIYECNHIKKTISKSCSKLKLSIKDLDLWYKCTVIPLDKIRELELQLDLPSGVIEHYDYDRIRSITIHANSITAISQKHF